MPVIVTRISKGDNDDLERLVGDGSFMNRSEAVRSAIRLLVHTMAEAPKGAKA